MSETLPGCRSSELSENLQEIIEQIALPDYSKIKLENNN